jgi:hypothetical protein
MSSRLAFGASICAWVDSTISDPTFAPVSRGAQLINVPEIAAAAMFVEPQHKMIVAATVDTRPGVTFGQQPYVTAVIARPVFAQQVHLNLPGLHIAQ